MAKSELEQAIARVKRLAAATGLPEIVEGTSFDVFALRVRDKPFVRVKDALTMVLSMPLEQKDLLLEVAPEIYYQTDHYKGWPGLLVRLDVIGDAELQGRIAAAWRYKAPKRLAALVAGKERP